MEQENDDLELDKDVENDEIKGEKNSLEDENKGLKEEIVALKECCDNKKESEGEGEGEGEKQVGGENMRHEFNTRNIEIDNITKEGGGSKDKNIKNVVVSFF